MHAEATLVPLMFFGSVFAFPLVRRHLIHRHEMEKLDAARPVPLPQPGAAPTPDDTAPAMALRLPEPHRRYALALLCRLQDAPYDHLGNHGQFVLRQARLEYLPDTLRAYLNLTPATRQHLRERGHSPEGHLREQLETIAQGVSEALDQGDTAERLVLTQGQFLRERFGDGPATVRDSLQS
ncbi:hypothetical protein [Deinococcus sp.]|uniref:hypothetical protein n=1 Tax=Deinococcus sp. TaxID=47478 RepID=UPI002869CC78|nr:hypothetical protein [Deinococcus sp.]